MNDERPIEKLLRRYAQKRRDEAGAPAELHPANRRALQAEVARQFPPAQRREGWWAGFSLLLNRKLAYAVAALAVVAVGALLVRPPKNEPMGLAALDAKRTAEKELSPTGADEAIPAPMTIVTEAKDSFRPEPTIGPAPPTVRTESFSVADASTRTASELNPSTAQAPPLAMAPVSRPRVSPDSNVEADRTAMRQQQVAESVARYNDQYGGRAPARGDEPSMAPAAQPLSAAAPQPAIAPTGASSAQPRTTGLGGRGGGGGAKAELTKSVQNYSQPAATSRQFRSGPANANTAPVLVNFVVEQTGDEIRVTDSDDSTYVGKLQLAVDGTASPVTRGGGTGRSEGVATYAAPVAEQTGGAVAQNYFFRLNGTNRTLNQPVNFVGTFVALTNQASVPATTAQVAEKTKEVQDLQQILPRLENSAIQGRLQIGTGREIELNALPVKP